MNRTRRPGWLFGAALLALLGGCDDAVAPAGNPSTLSVHAYVDADGSGGISQGDVPLPGVTVRLTPAGGSDGNALAVLTATTDANGVARFDNVLPGSWQVTASGPVPEGAVLATASTPVISAPYRGGELAAEFRYVFNPGGISGRIFRDNNANNQFDPGVDTPAPGIPVSLYSGAAATGEPVATTTTDAQGVFSFGVLRPGQYTWQVSPLPTMTITGGTTQTVTVQAQQTAQVAVRFTGNLIVPIAQARGLGPGAGAAVEGVVTVGTGVFAGNQVQVQDASGGILVFGVPSGTTFARGDSVRVSGQLGAFRTEVQLTQPTIERLGSGTVPAPRLLTAAQLAAGERLGQLVRVGGLRVDSVGGSPTSTAYDVIVSGLDGTAARVRVQAAGVGVPQTFWQVGRRYDITGVVGMFDNVPQLKVRGQDDIATAATPGILSVRRAGAGQTVTIEGVVTAGTGVFSTNANSNQFNVQDATGGILVLQVPLSAGIQAGDSVRVTGTTAVSSGEFVITSNPTVTRLAQNRPMQPPVSVTAQAVAASTSADTLQGRMVRVHNVRVESVGAGSGGYNVFATGPTGGSFIIRVSLQSIAPQSFWQVGSSYDIVGALSNFNGAQVKVRSAADIAPAGTLPMAIGQARQQPAGTQVTVTGVVTAGVGVFSTNATSNQFNVQDATGGVLVLQVPLASGIALGDSVRVTGNTNVSAGEFSITGTPTVTRIAAGRPVPAPITVSGQHAAASTASDPLQGMLVRVNDVRVDSLGTGATAYNVFATGANGGSFIVRVGAAATNVTRDMWTVGQRYSVTGTLASFNAPQIKVRMASDVAAPVAGSTADVVAPAALLRQLQHTGPAHPSREGGRQP
jgi:cytochrome c-type biogenesis protein CcmE